MTEDQPPARSIELSVEVPGTPEEVWAAVATGPGISSWYVPTTVEEREGGATTSVFGPGEGMTVPGKVTAWEPPRRVVFAGEGADAGFAFEWLVEARDNGSCVVRLINSGFGSGDDWDAQYDAMEQGWGLFLRNLQLHLEHFSGQAGQAMLPTATWPGNQQAAWEAIAADLGIPPHPAPGQRIRSRNGMPPLDGTILDSEPGFRASVLLESPLPGTAFIAAEGMGEEATGVSVWLYLYGDDAADVVARDEPLWRAWLER